MAGWLVGTASILVPVTVMILAFSDFNGARGQSAERSAGVEIFRHMF
ncbi:MAG: hypothetical protein GY778_28905 [bacterium]|nr:hypothetical protein [bacterium]